MAEKTSGKALVVQVLIVAAALSLFALSVVLSDAIPRRRPADDMRVRVPPALQLASAVGDHFLSANVNLFRAEMVGTGELDEETLHVLGAVQEDMAAMNPYKEDNFYLAAGVLPWGGEVDPAISVLTTASESRRWDEYPPFFLGFCYQYFRSDFASAAKWATVASDRATGMNKAFFRGVAARWYEQSNDPREAIGMLRILAQTSRDAQFKQSIAVRIRRVEGLIALRQASAAYVELYGAPAHRLDDLLGYGGLMRIPDDPTGIGYKLDEQGLPILAPRTVAGHG